MIKCQLVEHGQEIHVVQNKLAPTSSLIVIVGEVQALLFSFWWPRAAMSGNIFELYSGLKLG
jgi:hypothetical protein